MKHADSFAPWFAENPYYQCCSSSSKSRVRLSDRILVWTKNKLLGSSRLNFWQIEIAERICLIAWWTAWWTRTCPLKIETFWWEWFDFIHSYALRMCLRDATTAQPEVFHGTRLSCLYLRQSFGKVDFQPSPCPLVSANEISTILLKKTERVSTKPTLKAFHVGAKLSHK